MNKKITPKRKPLSKLQRGESVIKPGTKTGARVYRHRGYKIYHFANTKTWTIFPPSGAKSVTAHSLEAAKKWIDKQKG